MRQVKTNDHDSLKELSDQHASFITEVLKSNGIIIKEISTQPMCKAGDNYASDIFSVKIKAVNEEVLNVVVKVSQNSTSTEMADLNNLMFKNETTMYAKVLVEFMDMQIKLKATNIFESPHLYGASIEKTNEIIILEDLNEKSYTMLDKLKPLSDNTIKLALSNLAQFHSFSFAIKAKSPEKYLELCKSLEDTNSFKDLSQQENGFWVLGYYFSEMFDDIKYKNTVIDSFSKHIARINSLNICGKNSKYSVIIHGDCWVNNILFKLKDDLPERCILIDYQLSKEASPVEDILHLIFNSTDYETRSQHYYDWLDFYYSELQKYLLKFNLDTSVYPKLKFDAHVKRCAKAHLGIAIIKSCFLLREANESEFIKDALSTSENIEDLISNLKTSSLTVETVKRIKDRIEGLIESCKELGYLKRKKKRKALKKKKKIRYRKDMGNLKPD